MNEELKALAEQALCNAFWYEFSALVNAFLQASEGLNTDSLKLRMAELANPYSRDRNAESDITLNIWTNDGVSSLFSTGHQTLMEALEYEPATEVHLCGKKIFEKRDEEWYFVGSYE